MHILQCNCGGNKRHLPVSDKPNERAPERKKLKGLELKFVTQFLNLVVLLFAEIGKDDALNLMGDVNTEGEVVVRGREERASCCTNAMPGCLPLPFLLGPYTCKFLTLSSLDKTIEILASEGSNR